LNVEKNLDYFRRLEAFIRINSETTDYRLPSDKIRLKVLSAAMGESSTSAFLRVVRTKRKENHSILTSVLKSRLQ
jgi:glutamine synthetase adenylyltransferase